MATEPQKQIINYTIEKMLELMGFKSHSLSKEEKEYPINYDWNESFIINFSEYNGGIKYELGVKIDDPITIYDFYNIIRNKYDGNYQTYEFENKDDAKKFIKNFMFYKYKRELDILKNKINLDVNGKVNKIVDDEICGTQEHESNIDEIFTKHKDEINNYEKCTTYKMITKNENTDQNDVLFEKAKNVFKPKEKKPEEKKPEEKTEEKKEEGVVPLNLDPFAENPAKVESKINKQSHEKKREVEMINKSSKKKKISKKHEDDEDII
jgi:hypothetical protein